VGEPLLEYFPNYALQRSMVTLPSSPSAFDSESRLNALAILCIGNPACYWAHVNVALIGVFDHCHNTTPKTEANIRELLNLVAES
jgi:hypothetical protein